MWDIVSVGLLGADQAPGAIATFGHVFQQGDAPSERALTAAIDGVSTDLQVDVKSTWPDGSIKHAVLSYRVPADAGPNATLTLARMAEPAPTAPPLDLAAAANDLDLRVELEIDGRTVTVDLAEALAADTQPDLWLLGPLTAEARVTVDLPEGLSLRADIRARADGETDVSVMFAYDDIYATADEAELVYSARVLLDGREVDAVDSLSHVNNTNWRSIASTADAPSPHPMFDQAFISGAGVGLGIDHTVETALGDYFANAEGVNGPMGTGVISPSFGLDAGGTPNYGVLPSWAAAWWVEQSPETFQTMLDQAEAAGAMHWHFTDPATGRAVRIDEHPESDLTSSTGGDAWGRDSRYDLREVFALDDDSSHTPSLSFLPYLVTGERRYLDELEHQTAYDLLVWNRNYSDNDGRLDILGTELRGQAWALRDLFQASTIAPDGAYKDYLDDMLDARLQAYLDFHVNGETITRGGAAPVAYAFEDTELDGVLMQRSGRSGFDRPYWQDFFGQTLGQIAAAGNAKAQALAEWMAGFSAERFLQAEFDPYLGAAYQIVSDAAGLTQWSEIADAADRSIDSQTLLHEKPGQSFYPITAWASLGSLFSGTQDARYAEAYLWMSAAAEGRMSNFEGRAGGGGVSQIYGPQYAMTPTLADGTRIALSDHSTGSDGADRWTDGDGDAVHHARGGDDRIVAGDGGHLIDGGDGDDDIRAGDGEDWLFGGSGRDVIDAGGGRNVVRGDRFDVDHGRFADLFVISADEGETEILDFSIGDRLRLGDVGGALASAEDGVDGVTLQAGGATVLLRGLTRAELGMVDGDIALASEARAAETPVSHRGGDGDDAMKGTFKNDGMRGGDGDDDMNGSLGDDDMRGEAGDDRLIGHFGHDRLYGDEGDDRLWGFSGADLLDGGDGDDLLIGGVGADRLLGGAGDDHLRFDGDDLTVLGGAGFDRAVVDARESRGMTLELAPNEIEFARGGRGDDRFDASGLDAGAMLRGGAGDDALIGGVGADRLLGERDDDSLFGDDGDDVLRGDDGDDRLSGGAGADRLHGGAGADTFAFALGDDFDRIFDFDPNQDRIVFSSGVVREDVTLRSSAGVLIEYGDGDSIRLVGVSLDAVSIDDFIFNA